MTMEVERNNQVDTEAATQTFVLTNLDWKTQRPATTLKQANSQMRLSRAEVLRRAEANTVKLTGKNRF
ncbi:MAG: hypothetical protein ACHRHE_12420 [Tepidisphaerales bacterium]